MNMQESRNGKHSTLDKGLDELGRAYRDLADDNPPELLDQAIRNRARRELEKKTGWMQFGWLHGLTTAAVIVLAFSIVLQQREPVSVEEGLILESVPSLKRSESVSSDRMQQAAPAAAMKLEAEETADSNLKIRGYNEPYKEGQVLEQVADTPAEARELGVSLQEERAPNTRAKAPVVIDADFAQIIASQEPNDEDTTQGMVPAEIRLAEILRLKNAGDESWKDELEDFRQNFPDYPLPAELQD